MQTEQRGEPVAWLVDIEDEPELGHWFSEEPLAVKGYRSRPLYLAAPAPSASPAALTDEREAFEDAWRAQYPDHGLTVFVRSLHDNSRYTNTRTQDGWLMWQARALALVVSPADRVNRRTHSIRNGAPRWGVERDARDAARYRWLRERHWDESTLFVVAGHHSLVRLGTDCPSDERLDAAIDAAMSASKEPK